MRVVVLGASGMLGTMLADVFEREHDLELVCTAVEDTALERGRRILPRATWLSFDADRDPRAELPGVLEGAALAVNAIGIIKPYIRVDRTEEVQRAIRINSLFPHVLAEAARQVGAVWCRSPLTASSLVLGDGASSRTRTTRRTSTARPRASVRYRLQGSATCGARSSGPNRRNTGRCWTGSSRSPRGAPSRATPTTSGTESRLCISPGSASGWRVRVGRQRACSTSCHRRRCRSTNYWQYRARLPARRHGGAVRARPDRGSHARDVAAEREHTVLGARRLRRPAQHPGDGRRTAWIRLPVPGQVRARS